MQPSLREASRWLCLGQFGSTGNRITSGPLASARHVIFIVIA